MFNVRTISNYILRETNSICWHLRPPMLTNSNKVPNNLILLFLFTNGNTFEGKITEYIKMHQKSKRNGSKSSNPEY